MFLRHTGSNNEIEFITKQDLINVLKKYGQSVNLANYIFDNKKNLSLCAVTIRLCKVYESMLNAKKGQDSRFFNYKIKNVTGKANDFAIDLGAKIIFNLRKIFMERDITILMGMTNIDGTSLRTIECPITDILNDKKDYIANKKEGIKLIEELTKFENMEKEKLAAETNNQNWKITEDQQRNTVWEKIYKAGNLIGTGRKGEGHKEDFDAGGSYLTKEGAFKKVESIDPFTNRTVFQKIYDAETGKAIHKLYRLYPQQRSQNKDINMYYAYSHGKNSKVLKYFRKEDGKFVSINNGWLFEWFMHKWTNLNDEEEKIMFIRKVLKSNSPIQHIVEKNDAIWAKSGGDFRGSGIDYQAKHGNRKLISSEQIKTVMKQIIKCLNDHLEFEKDAPQKISKKFGEIFTSPQNLDILDDNLRKINNTTRHEVIKDLENNFQTKIVCSVKI